ncbi:MAG: hypothetical protein IKA51_05755 [Clostridia bacterium]|nr:hypothetical protein [Clostridia bacterium]
MKKIISIIIATTMLLIAFCSCTPSQTEFSYNSNMRFVTEMIDSNSNQQSSTLWYDITSLATLQYHFFETIKENVFVFKVTVAGPSVNNDMYDEIIAEYSSKFDPDDERRRLGACEILTPVKIEEIYYSSNPDVRVGDIITVSEHYIYLDEELRSKMPNTVEKYNLKIGDIIPTKITNKAFYREMFLEEGYSFIVFCCYQNDRSYYCTGYWDLAVYSIDREPMPVDYYGKYEEHEYQRYLNIRKDAIDYYINGNKEVLK